MTRGTLVIRLLVVAALAAQSAWPEDPAVEPSEYEVKAAFLYNFAKFVEWPSAQEEPNGSFQMCVFGKDPFGGALERVMGGKTVNGRRIMIRRISDIAMTQPCHVLFISASEADQFAEVVKAIQGRKVLTVGEINGFCQRGGVIAFVMDGQRVRFRINPKAAARAHLKISSKLLQLAVATPEEREKH